MTLTDMLLDYRHLFGCDLIYFTEIMLDFNLLTLLTMNVIESINTLTI